MSQHFDPYYRWLGISPKEQPPNHYRLLGVELFESDPQLIDSFALRHTSFLRQITDGPHLRDAQRLLNELAAARRCLLNPQQKAAYDGELRATLAAQRRLPSGSSDGMSESATPPVVDAAAASRQAAGDAPGIVVVPHGQSGAAVVENQAQRSKLRSTGAPSGHGSKPKRSPPRTSDASRIGTQVKRIAVAGAQWCANRAERRLVWLATGAALVLVAIGGGAAVMFRAKPSRPAVGGAGTVAHVEAATTRDESQRTFAATVPAVEPPAEPEQEPSATSSPESTADPAADDWPTASPPGLAAEDPAMRGSAPEPETPAAPSNLVPDGQPPRLAGLILWLDASELSAPSGRIARWDDGGGNYTARPRQPSDQPEVLAQTLGGKNVVRFRGAQWLEISGTSQAMNLGSEFTIAYVARGVAGTLLAKGNGGNSGEFALQSDSCFLTGNSRLSAVDDDPTQFRIRTIVADATALAWFLDGTPGGGYSDAQHEVQNRSVLRIGCPSFRAGQGDSTQFFVGDLAELVIYGRALPEDERLGVEDYLREKWLSSGEPVAALDLVAPRSVPPAEQRVTADRTPKSPREPAGASLEELPLAERGEIYREVWHNFYGMDVNAVRELWDLRSEPDLRETVKRFEAPEDFGDNYCQRFRGYLQPPTTGEYTFTVRANEDGVLFVSTDERPENIRQVHTDDKIPLTAGRAYYVEAIHWEKGGKDYFSVGWRLPNGKQEDPVPGRRLSLRHRPVPAYELGFVPLLPTRAEASEESGLQILDDGSVLADGTTKENEIYRLVCEISMSAVTALQLQAVSHESLPAGGPGFGLGGSFRLAEIEVSVVEADQAARKAKIREVFSPDGDSGMARLVDGNLATVWSCRPGRQGISLTLLLAEPVRTSGVGVLNVTLHNRENLGCFRLLATAAAEPRTLASAASQSPAPVGSDGSDLFRLFVNLGGGPWQDPDGNSWVASKKFDGTTFGHEAGQSIKSDLEHPVYGTAVRGLIGFRALVPNGDYSVELHFQENWARNPDDRAFTAAVEQIPVIRPPRFFHGPGMGQPYVHTIGKVSVRDERLDVDFSPIRPGAHAILNGIVIRQVR